MNDIYKDKLDKAKEYAKIVQLHKPTSIEAWHKLWLEEQKELEKAVIRIINNWSKNGR